jgi:hypothetical protein
MSADTKAAFLFAQEAACMVYANQLTSSTAGSEAFVLGSYRAGTLLILFLFALKYRIYAAISIITVNAFHSKLLASTSECWRSHDGNRTHFGLAKMN